MQTETPDPSSPPAQGSAGDSEAAARAAELEAELARLRGERSSQLARLQDRVYWLERYELEPESLVRITPLRWLLEARVRWRHFRKRRR
jgi:hypothetical protein